jgi:hypothetical protein
MLEEKIMKSVKKLGAISAALVVLATLNSCADFFSTSWGDLFKRDPAKVKVTSSNVNDLLDAAKGDKELARAILDQIDGNSSDTLKRAAIKAANQASDLSALALENVSSLLDAMDNPNANALQDLADKINAQAQGNDLEGVSKKLVSILTPKLEYINPIAAGRITATAHRADGTEAPVDIKIYNDNNNTATVTIDGVTYSGTIDKSTGIITLPNNGTNGPVTIHYYDNNNDTIALTGLNQIQGAGITETSVNSDVTHGKPVFEAGFLDDVPDSDLTLLVMTLILAKAEKEKAKSDTMTLNDYFESWTTKNLETGKNIDDEELLIAAIVNGMIERGELTNDESELTKMLKDLLGGVN